MDVRPVASPTRCHVCVFVRWGVHLPHCRFLLYLWLKLIVSFFSKFCYYIFFGVIFYSRLHGRYHELAPHLVPMDYTNDPDCKLPLALIVNMPELKVKKKKNLLLNDPKHEAMCCSCKVLPHGSASSYPHCSVGAHRCCFFLRGILLSARSSNKHSICCSCGQTPDQ